MSGWIGRAEATKPGSGERAEFRTDIQALRAIAVLAVVFYHLWPNVLRAGYVGVDVFFVISGYLISSHLVRSLERTGSIALGRFWARRVRRLLPLAGLVLIVTVLASLAWMPPSTWLTTLRGVVTATLYVENWRLASDSVDYLARDHVTGPVQQYWSLSVEEQFYLMWPVLLLAAVALARAVLRRRQDAAEAAHASPVRVDVRRVVLVAVACVGLASFAYSVMFTVANPSVAYFSTFTRGWEFALGAACVFVPAGLRSSQLRPVAQAVLSWLGAALVLVAAFFIPHGTPFPGAIALVPALGAALFIVAGTGTLTWVPGNLGRLRPVERIGDLSYGIYLWHWPLVVITPYALGDDLSVPLKLTVLAASIGLAALTKPFIEDKIRFAARWQGGGPRGFAPGVIAMALSLVVVAIPFRIITSTPAPEVAVPTAPAPGSTTSPGDASTSAEATPSSTPPAPSTPPATPTPPPPSEFSEMALVPTIATRGEDHSLMYDCFDFGKTKLFRCDYGPVDAPVSIAITGDSHAAHHIPGLYEAAMANGWRLSTFVGMNCDGGEWAECGGGAEIAQTLTTEHFDLVLISSVRFSITPREELVQHFTLLRDAGVNLVVIEDVPLHPQPTYECIDRGDGTVRGAEVCVTSIYDGLEYLPDRGTEIAEELGLPVVGMRDLFCDDAMCVSVIGNVLVYQDSPASHLTTTMSRQLGGFWSAQISSLLGLSTAPD